MNSLNTDCLIEIVKLLSLKDQISVYQVHSSLQVAVTALWQIKFKHIRINFSECDLCNEEFGIFLKSVQDIVEVLQLRFLNKEKYEILIKFCFERVNNFRFTLSKPYFMKDDDLKDLQRVLPKIEAFSPHGNFSGLYMDEWPLLKDLNLSYCFKLDVLHFQNILSQLKLEKLKLNIFPNNNKFDQMNLVDAQVHNLNFLELNTYEFYYFLSKPLTALKELIITNHYNPRQLFDVILSIWRANDIRLVETANVDNVLLSCVEIHMNIEQLCIVNDENPLPSIIIPSLHLLTDLRKLRLKDCSIELKNFHKLIKNIPQLNEISFEGCQFDTANICIKVGEICANRKEKLRLNMFENRLIDNVDTPTWRRGMVEVTYVSVDLIGNHNLFELTKLKGDDLCYEPLYIVYR